MFLIEFNACARNIITNINSLIVMTFSSEEKKIQVCVIFQAEISHNNNVFDKLEFFFLPRKRS